MNLRLLAKVLLLAGSLALGRTVAAAETPAPAESDISAVAKAIVELFESSHQTTFAEGLAPSLDDWKAVAPTNLPSAEVEVTSAEWRQSVSATRQRLSQSARRALGKASSLKVDFSKVQLTPKNRPLPAIGSAPFPVLATGAALPLLDRVDIVLTAEPQPDAEGAEALRGEYVVRVTQLVKFPGGWRCLGGLEWVSFPGTVADEQARNEMALEAKLNANGPIEGSDDPALARLGEALASCLRKGDAKQFESDAMLTFDAMKLFFQKMTSVGRPLPSDSEITEQLEKQNARAMEPTKAMLAFMAQQGIDLQDAALTVKKVSLKHASSRFASGSLEGMSGDGLRVVISAKSAKAAKTGKNLSGDYTLATEQAMRVGGRWHLLSGLRLDEMPDGVLDEKTLADLKREASVAESGYLPVGTAAPDIEFVRLSDEQKMKLSDLRGKVVILDFWATWCGPCQEPMAHMQKYREENPEWKDRVAVVALSIDDTIKTVRTHMEKRGWTNTFNTWVGEGAWESGATKAFHVRGVPTCYVIDPEGKIVQAGHPAAMRAPDTVNKLLK